MLRTPEMSDNEITISSLLSTSRDGFETADDMCLLFAGDTHNGSLIQNSIDDTKPTLGIMHASIGGSGGLLLEQTRQVAPANIIGLNFVSTAYMNVVDGQLLTHHGYLLGHDGRLIHGTFEEPIRIDAIEEAVLDESSRQLLKDSACEVYTAGDLHSRMLSKQFVKEMLSTVVDFAPGLHVPCGNINNDQIDAFLQKSREVSPIIVIKPLIGMQGSDVRFFDNSNTKAATDYIRELHERRTDVLVETYIEPLTIREEDRELETNIRALSFGSFSIDSLEKLLVVRVGEKGKPTNVATGAVRKPIEWLFDQASLRRLDVDMILKNIIDIQMKIREVSVKTFGSDLIIDNDGKVWVIEVNTGNLGALNMLASLKPTLQQKLDFYAEMAQYITVTKKLPPAESNSGRINLNEEKQIYFDAAHIPTNDYQTAIKLAQRLMNHGMSYANTWIGRGLLHRMKDYFWAEAKNDDSRKIIEDFIDELLRIDPEDKSVIKFIANHSFSYIHPRAEELLLDFKTKNPEAGMFYLGRFYTYTDQTRKLIELLQINLDDTTIDFEDIGKQFSHRNRQIWASNDSAIEQASPVDLQKATAEAFQSVEVLCGNVQDSISFITTIPNKLMRRCAIRVAWHYFSDIKNYQDMLLFARAFPSVCTKWSYRYHADQLRNQHHKTDNDDYIRYVAFLGKTIAGKSHKRLMNSVGKAHYKKR